LKFYSLEQARKMLMSIEGKFDEQYFPQIFKLLPEKIRPDSRKTFKAYDGINNIFNLAYEVLSWKVHRALIRAKLEPYLGFIHSMQYGKPKQNEEIAEYLHNRQMIKNISKKLRNGYI